MSLRKYDTAWLARMHKMEQVIRDVQSSIGQVPHIPDRSLVTEQFNLNVRGFRDALRDGFDTATYEEHIYDLGELVYQLIEDGEYAAAASLRSGVTYR